MHVQCRQRYINKKDIALTNKPTVDRSSSHGTRSSTGGFNFRTNCFLCGQIVTERQKRDGKSVNVACKHCEVDAAIIKAINLRNNDEWALVVNGRLDSVNELRAEDAIYHKACNSSFRTGKPIPQMFGATNMKEEGITRKSGRPVDVEREAAFVKIAEYLKENDEEQITLTDLTCMMGEILTGTKTIIANNIQTWCKHSQYFLCLLFSAYV